MEPLLSLLACCSNNRTINQYSFYMFSQTIIVDNNWNSLNFISRLETRIELRQSICTFWYKNLYFSALPYHIPIIITVVSYSNINKNSSRKMKLLTSLVFAMIFVLLIENMIAKYLLVDLDQERKVGRGPRVPLPSSKNIWLLWESVVRFHIFNRKIKY